MIICVVCMVNIMVGVFVLFEVIVGKIDVFIMCRFLILCIW